MERTEIPSASTQGDSSLDWACGRRYQCSASRCSCASIAFTEWALYITETLLLIKEN